MTDQERKDILIKHLNNVPSYNEDDLWYHSLTLLLDYINDDDISKAFWGREKPEWV